EYDDIWVDSHSQARVQQTLEQNENILENFRKLWFESYLLSLREHSRDLYQISWENKIKVGDVVLIRSPVKPRPFWLLGKVLEVIIGYDNKIRSVKLRQAEKLTAEGFNIQVNEVGFGDVLCNFTFSNGTYKNTLEYEFIGSVLPTGGEPAKVARAYYMAQIGEQKEGKIKWLCDGVLINNRWILSAAHCFTEPGVYPNVVRLGDLDKSDFKDPPLDRKREFIRDYPIQQLVPYPEFNVNERYHDIVLIQIPRPIPLYSV
ncbi:Coagulation factor IX, partial [Armadillidium nasatum]